MKQQLHVHRADYFFAIKIGERLAAVRRTALRTWWSRAEAVVLVDNHPILRYNSKQLWRHYKITETNDYEN